jgi:hypothetical protein
MKRYTRGKVETATLEEQTQIEQERIQNESKRAETVRLAEINQMVRQLIVDAVNKSAEVHDPAFSGAIQSWATEAIVFREMNLMSIHATTTDATAKDDLQKLFNEITDLRSEGVRCSAEGLTVSDFQMPPKP